MEPFEQLLAANRSYVDGGGHRPLPARPSRALAIVTCMDTRIDAFAMFGLQLGEAHIVRVAGARATPDALRSLALSTHALGVRSVAVVGHTDCGLADPDGTLVTRLDAIMGRPPANRDWFAFVSVETAVREDCETLRGWDDRPDDFAIAGYVLDVATGGLTQVVAPQRIEPRRP